MTMRRPTAGTLALLCLAPAAIAWSSGREPLALQPHSRLWVDGTSTVRSFQCTATAFETRVESSVPGAVSAVVAGTKAVSNAELTVPATSLDCRSGKMNEHMLKALEAEQHPTIVFRITSYEVAKAAGGVDGSAVGELTLGGVTKTITVTAHAVQEPGGVLRLTGAREIRMTEFGLKPPSLMMGTLRVDAKVTVGFDLLLKGQSPIS
jgi:polyisoprenoid-binding protein YceI